MHSTYYRTVSFIVDTPSAALLTFEISQSSFSDPSGLLTSGDSQKEASPETKSIGKSRYTPKNGSHVAKLDNSRLHAQTSSKHDLPTLEPASPIAPWDSAIAAPTLSTHDLTSGNFFDEGLNNVHLSPNFYGDSPSDHLSLGDDRRPSQISESTTSSQNSATRPSTKKTTPHKKLPGLFSDGRHSSQNSEISIPASLQRERTQSSNQSSVQSNSFDGPPRSADGLDSGGPKPSGEVTPWMFQNFQVSARPYHTCQSFTLPDGEESLAASYERKTLREPCAMFFEYEDVQIELLRLMLLSILVVLFASSYVYSICPESQHFTLLEFL